jgi:hypothetical protein
VNRALAIAVLSLGACGADVDEPWQLAHDRIIAVRAEPPRIAPGEQSTIDLLVGFKNQPAAERAPDIAMVQSPTSLGDLMTQSGDAWVVTAPTEERLAAARSELGLMPDAPVPLSVGVAAAWPNPVMSPNPAGFGALKTVWLGDTGTNPTLEGLTVDGVDVPAGQEIVVAKDTEIRLFVEADDTVQIVNWLTSCGEMHDFDLHSAYLTVGPDDPQEGELAVILRDERGGVAWRVWPIRSE